ncbi:hypothetical protein G6F65_018283 [Rhizopus arrhizus]|nr:hypothetical protein G6F65_018283 [Rhizopus arrhizus]
MEELNQTVTFTAVALGVSSNMAGEPLIEAGDDQGNVLARLTTSDDQQAAKLGALEEGAVFSASCTLQFSSGTDYLSFGDCTINVEPCSTRAASRPRGHRAIRILLRRARQQREDHDHDATARHQRQQEQPARLVAVMQAAHGHGNQRHDRGQPHHTQQYHHADQDAGQCIGTVAQEDCQHAGQHHHRCCDQEQEQLVNPVLAAVGAALELGVALQRQNHFLHGIDP